MKAKQQVPASAVDAVNARRMTARLCDPTVLVFFSGLIGLFLRLYHLSNNSLWIDEGYRIWFANFTPSEIFIQILSSDVHPPTYYLLLHYWMGLFGKSESALRFLSVLLGIATIFVVFRIATILAGATVGAVACLLFAVSPIQIQYDTEVNIYALLVFAAAIAIWGAARFVDGMTRPSALRAALPLFAGGTILAMASQNTGVLLWGTLAAVTAVAWFLGGRPRPAAKYWLLYNGLVSIAFALWLPYLLNQLKNAQVMVRMWPVSVHTLTASLGPLFAPKITEVAPILAPVAAIGVAAIALAGMWAWHGRRLALVFCVSVGILPVIISVIISLVVRPIIITRIYLWLLIPLYILIAAAIVNFRPNLIRYSMIVTLVVVNGVGLFTFYYVWHWEDWRSAMRDITAAYAPADLILIPNPILAPVMDYYAHFLQKSIILISNPAATAQAVAKTAGHRVWQISLTGNDLVDKNLVTTALSANHARERAASYYLVQVSLWQPRAHK
jgi:mannosyltransferase